MLSLFQHLWLSGWSTWIQASDGVKMFEPRGEKMVCVQTSACSSNLSSCCFPCKLADPSKCSGQSSRTPGGGNRASFQDSCMDALHIYNGLAQCVCFLQWEMLDLFLVDKPTACGQQVQPEHTEHIVFLVLPVVSVLWMIFLLEIWGYFCCAAVRNGPRGLWMTLASRICPGKKGQSVKSCKMEEF